MTNIFFPIGALHRGKIIYREGWNGEKEMKIINPDEWEGMYPIGAPMIMVRDTNGSWGIWCNCQADILAADWKIKEEVTSET